MLTYVNMVKVMKQHSGKFIITCTHSTVNILEVTI